MRGNFRVFPFSRYGANTLHRLTEMEDKVTSMRWNLPSNAIATFYENSDGTGREYTVMHDAARSGSRSNVGSCYNDKFSSFRWRRVTPSQGWVKFYTNGGYAGYELVRYRSLEGRSAKSLFSANMNDQVDSMRWSLPQNETLFVFDESPAGGMARALTLNGQVDIRNVELHDKISTFQFVQGDLCADFADRNRPYDRNCYLSSHNAHASAARGWVVWNQNRTLTEQLDYGARTLQLDTRIDNGTIYLVHGSITESLLQRSGLPLNTLGNALIEINSWLQTNPREVVTLIFENHDTGVLGDYLLDQSSIRSRIYDQNRLSWPTLNELIAMGKRVIVFDSKSGTRLSDQYDYSVENDYGSWGSTNRRSESDAINDLNRSLFYMNYINPQPPSTWVPLAQNPNTFSNLWGLASQMNQTPNYVGVDRIATGDHGGIETTRAINQIRWRDRDPFGVVASAARFGHNRCGSPTTTSSFYPSARPVAGTTLSLSLAGPTNSFNFLMIGFSDSTWAGQSLPYALPGGCQIKVEPELVRAIFLGPGSLSIPADPNLVGSDAFLQVLHAQANGTASTSQAFRLHIGQR